jgi:hypothetical protein
MIRTLVRWVEALVAKATDLVADYLEAKPAPESAVLLPFSDTPLENQMDVFARRATATLLYVGAAVMFLLPNVSPRLANPVGELMHRLATVLLAGL